MSRKSKTPHEHFCFMCYPRKTNGIARGYWRCFDAPCVKTGAALCKKCRALEVKS